MMKISEDDETGRSIEKNETDEAEYKMPATSQMNSLAMWVHGKTNILLNGRTTHLEPEEPAGDGEGEEFDPEAALKAIKDADPFEELLKPLTLDAPVKISSTSKVSPWSVRFLGDQTEYADEKTKGATVSNGVVIVRSNVWPGACSLYYKGRILQIYLGNGHKQGCSQGRFPVNPPEVMDDPEEYEEGPEPTPLEAPEVKEEEAKGEEEEGEEEQEEDP